MSRKAKEKKKKEKKRRGNVPKKAQKKKSKKEKEKGARQSPCASAHGHFCQEIQNPHPVFSPFWEENILVGSGRKHQSPSIFFSRPPF